MSAHTPGPLDVQRYHGGFFVVAPSPDSDSQHRVTIAQFPDAQLGAMHLHQAAGNAHLFVAAPLLLAALREHLAKHEDEWRRGVIMNSDAEWVERARAAIAKAEGA